MNIFNLFRRKAAVIPRPSFQAMYARDYVKSAYIVPITYGELMDMHRKLGIACADRRISTDYIFTNDLKIQLGILQRANEKLYAQGQVAPTVRKIISHNTDKWLGSLEPQRMVRTCPRITFRIGVGWA